MANEDNKWTYEAFGDYLEVQIRNSRMIAIYAKCTEGECVMMPDSVALDLRDFLTSKLEGDDGGD